MRLADKVYLLNVFFSVDTSNKVLSWILLKVQAGNINHLYKSNIHVLI